VIVGDAISADRDGQVVKAATLYEIAIQSGEADVEVLLNLAVLYWESTDTGFRTHHILSDDFVDHAGFRYREILDEVGQRFPSVPSARFWRLYITSIKQGVQPAREEYLAIQNDAPDYLEPEIVLIDDGDITRARKLLKQCETIGTARARYVAAVLGGIFARLKN